MDYDRIRPNIIQSLRDYADKGYPVGGFLTAALSNDLMGAVGRADRDNAATLHDICGYIYNEIPSPCHGSPEAVEEWLTRDWSKERSIDNES